LALPLWGFLVAYTLVYCCWRLVESSAAVSSSLANRAAFVVPGLFAVALAWLASRAPGLDGVSQRAWRLLAAAFLAIQVGNALWLVDLLHPMNGFPLSDVGWLAYYPLVLAGILSFPRLAETRPERLQFWIDTGSVVCGGAMLVTYLVRVPAPPGVPPLRAALSLAYPLGDVALLTGVAVLILRRRQDPLRRAYLLLAFALLIEFAGDITWGSLALAGAQPNQAFSDLTYMVAWTLRGTAAFAYLRAATTTAPLPSTPDPEARNALGLLPYGSALLGYMALFAALPMADTPTLRVLAGGAAALTACALLSQWLTARDNLRLQTQQAERRSETRFRALVQSSSDVIVVIDERAAVRYVAPSAEAILGVPVARLVGRPFGELVHPDDRQRARLFVSHALLAPGVSSPAELRVGDADRWIAMEALAANLLYDPDIDGVVLTLRDIRERKALEEQLIHRALHDSLTGLANRALFADRLGRARQLSHHSGRSCALVVFDLDDFKAVNDGLGHGNGDQALVEIARRLMAVVADTDTAARLGGDEFAVLLENVESEDAARRTAEAMLEAATAPLAIGGKVVRLGGSVGVALSAPDVTDEELMKRADLALYHAKEAGKARVALFAAGMQSEMLRRHNLEAELREAIEQGELHLLYQPLYSLRSGRLVGAEALVRWRHRERGLVEPGDFIHLAESTGLIEPLGRWVISEACRQGAEWNRTALRALRVGVNLSVRQLHDSGLVGQVRSALAASGLAPDLLVCEITETLLGLDPLAATARLHELKAVGVRIALDDFGIGYSSLGRLRDLPIDILKIDREFTRGLATAQGALFAGAVVELGKALGLLVVAEGVEQPDQLAALRALRCDLAQGYHLARPMEADDLTAMLGQPAPMAG
jgi:diguanylate cyclase (GGDEF)-like protein/PAS domain S-box-containing protein